MVRNYSLIMTALSLCPNLTLGDVLNCSALLYLTESLFCLFTILLSIVVCLPTVKFN